VLVMSAGPGRLAAELTVEAPLPRGVGFRVSPLFRTAVERVSAALAQAMQAA
jgi:NitT/TauT family transport system ATP-binding protein